ncbi:MAG: sensor histidine kinase [Steroidobacteraceae bacterium]
MERWRFFGLLSLVSVLFLVGLYAVAELGRGRLEQAQGTMQAAMVRRMLVGELRQQVAEAALASRSLLLTERSEYLEPLRRSTQSIARVADALVTSYSPADPSGARIARQLRYLAGVQSGAIMSVAALYNGRGPEAARALALAQSRSVDPIAQFLQVASRVEQYEAAQVDAARANLRHEQRLVRILGLTGMGVNILLVLSAFLMALATLRRHRDGMAQIAQRKEELEVEAAARTAELNDVYGHLQTVQEQERSRLARGLHDELGGLLLAARMDATWVKRHARDAEPQALAARIDRILDVLDQGIDLKRRVIEELRPTLLDNMGLLAALRWQVDELCRRSTLACACHFPPTEPELAPATAIALFRIVQEALANVLKHAGATRADVTLDVAGDHVLLTIADDGRGITGAELARPRSHGLTGMRHRVVSLGGTLAIAGAPGGGTEVRVIVPRRGRPH